MCGIAGYFGRGSEEILKKMTNTLYHRGPDDKGFYVDEFVGLGHRRLSIIDLGPAARQPMGNEDGSVLVVLNGEIYNFRELKKELKNKHVLKSSSDTEVIVHLYEEIRDEVFSKLNGMFAVAIYDQNKRKLILARDRMGKKPLYWGIFNNTLIFGSELKALMEHPQFKKELDLKSLNKYLIYEYVPTPHSILKDVYKLEPGHYLVYDGKEVNKVKFWDISFRMPNCECGMSNILGELDNKIDKAVQMRLVSDVPLGIFLSGGIDSSAVAYYVQKNSAQKIKTFSIGFRESSFDESQYAREVADYLGTEHYEKILNARESLNLIPKISDLLDEPMADSSILPTFLLSEFTRGYVTVALGGDGGDELFCGYDTFVAHKLAEIYAKIPFTIRKKIIEKVALNLPTSFKNISFDFKAKKFISGFYGEKKYRNQRWLGAFDRRQRAELFPPDVWRELENENEFNDIDGYLDKLKEDSYDKQLIYLYLRMYMMDDILVKVDRASMYNSLEVRAPLLDYKLVEFINSLPVDYKMKGFKTKYIFKKLMEGRLPKEIIYRRKKGFGIPIAEWISGDLKSFALDLFNERKIKSDGLFNYQFISKLLNEHFAKKVDNRKLIWTLMVFRMWQERWLK